LITCGRTNELTHSLLTEYIWFSHAKALWLTEWDCTALRYITWQYSKLWWVYTYPYIQKSH